MWSAPMLGMLFYKVLPFRSTVARTTIAMAFPEMSTECKEHLLSEAYQHASKVLLLMLRIPSMVGNRSGRGAAISIASHVDYTFTSAYLEDVQRGHGVILVSAHIGFWELCSFVHRLVPAAGYYEVYRELHNPLLNSMVKEYRALAGVSLIKDKHCIQQCIRVLQQGALLGLVADQNAGDRGIEVSFLQRPSSFYPGMAVLHQRTGAPIWFTVVLPNRDKGTKHPFSLFMAPVAAFREELSVSQILQRYADVSSAFILSAPEDYLWFHRRWKVPVSL